MGITEAQNEMVALSEEEFAGMVSMPDWDTWMFAAILANQAMGNGIDVWLATMSGAFVMGRLYERQQRVVEFVVRED